MARTINMGKVVGSDATINGVSSATINASNGVELTQNGSTLSISAPGIANHNSNTNNPHSVTKAQIGLGNVENKSAAQIIGEMTASDIEQALGYVPGTGNSDVEIDSALSSTSENAVQNKVVKAALDGKQNVESGKGLSTNDYTTAEKTKLAGVEAQANKTVVDQALSTSSSNPVANSAIVEALNSKQAKISGTAGQVLAFDSNGNLAATDSSAITGIELLSIAITTAPTKTSYLAGETFDPTGMVVHATYSKQLSGDVTGYTVSPSTLAAGTTSVTVTYTEGGVTKTATQAITVTKRSITIPSPVAAVQADDQQTVKSPSWNNYNTTYMTIGGTTQASVAGTYTATFTLVNTDLYQWSDGTTAPKNVNWVMNPPYELYGFQLNLTESNPASKITYLGNCDNASYTAAGMNFTTGAFNYGDWGDAFFIKNIKPVMLKYDGTVDYELNKNNYQKKADGVTNSDATNDAYAGNVMIGIPTVYIKVDTSDANNPKFYISNENVDGNYKAYAHTNANGDIIPYTYMPAYNGWKDGSSRLRSISGKVPTRNETGTNQITQCRANNPSGKNIWDLEVLSDRELITILLMLIGKNTNAEGVFGCGNKNGYNNKASGSDTNGVLSSGTMDDKGLFWGSTADNLGVKVFGIENFYGNIWRRTQGLINAKGTIKAKLCRGTQDGSSVSDYNTDGTGYVTIGTAPSSGYIKNMYVSDKGLYPKDGSGSDSTYFPDYVYTSTSDNYFALFGGNSIHGSIVGPFACHLNILVSISNWTYGASPSCKPEIAA